jgi:site-specific recombinase, phage integrase family
MLFKKKILYKDWLWYWMQKKKDYIKESTYSNYSNIISNHIIPDLGNIKLSNLNNKLIQEYLINKYKTGRLDGNGGLSNKTIRDIIAVVKSSLKYAIKEEMINNINLDFTYPKIGNKDKIYIIPKKDQEKLITYIKQNENTRSLGVLLALYSGIRIGELCALQWKDIDFKNNILHISKTLQRIYIKDNKESVSKIIITNPKTHNAERDIPLNKRFADILKKYQTKSNNYILSNCDKWIEPRTYRRYFKKCLDKAKIGQINFHGLRHTFATNCIKLGVDYKTVSELLGHANVNITLNLYVHPQMSQKKKCIDLICKNFYEKSP